MKKILLILLAAAAIGAAAGYYFTDHITVYDETGQEKEIPSFLLDDFKEKGWYEALVTTMYLPTGESRKIYASEHDRFEEEGWYDMPVTAMYAPDGRMLYVSSEEVGAYEEVGWYTEPVVAVFNSSGESMYVTESEEAKYEEEGWQLTPPTREGLEELKSGITDYLSGRSGDWGVYVKNMKTREYLSVNEKQYSSASLIKLFTMAAAFQKIEEGAMEDSSDIDTQLKYMITESSNTACNYLTKAVGGGNTINGFNYENNNTKSLGCANTQHQSELVDGKGKVTFIGYNRTSPMDCGLILEKIYLGELVSEEASRRMLDFLKQQTRTWKIPAALPEGVQTANKTGETNTVQGDAAIVYSPACDYIICVIGNGSVNIDTIRAISRMTYDYLNKGNTD